MNLLLFPLLLLLLHLIIPHLLSGKSFVKL
jgi:hypothetical protein